MPSLEEPASRCEQANRSEDAMTVQVRNEAKLNLVTVIAISKMAQNFFKYRPLIISFRMT